MGRRPAPSGRGAERHRIRPLLRQHAQPAPARHGPGPHPDANAAERGPGGRRVAPDLPYRPPKRCRRLPKRSPKRSSPRRSRQLKSRRSVRAKVAEQVRQVAPAVAFDDYIKEARYFAQYPEDLRTMGVSFNTAVGTTGWALQGEYSFRPDAPLQRLEDSLFDGRSRAAGMFPPSVRKGLPPRARRPPGRPLRLSPHARRSGQRARQGPPGVHRARREPGAGHGDPAVRVRCSARTARASSRRRPSPTSTTCPTRP